MAVGRVDYWRIRDEFSPYEWALLKAMNCVFPIGEDRADLRSAISTTRLVAANGAKVDEETFDAIRFYLKCNEPQPKHVTAMELKAAFEGMNNGRK